MLGAIASRHRQASNFVATPASTVTPGVLDPGWALIFDDEFNGTTLDSTQWQNQPSGTFNNVPVNPNHAAVSGGVLTMSLTTPGSPFTASAMTGCFIHGNTATPRTFGPLASGNIAGNVAGDIYVEARIRMSAANAKGAWHSFNLNTQGSFPEYDTIEFIGSDPTRMYSTYHNASGADTSGGGWPLTSFDLGAGYHIYQTYWTTTSIAFLLDGVQMLRFVNGQVVGGTTVTVGTSPAIMNMNTGVNGFGSTGSNSGSTPNVADATSVFPMTMKVDYVHVYKKNATGITPQTNYGGPGSTAGPTT